MRSTGRGLASTKAGYADAARLKVNGSANVCCKYNQSFLKGRPGHRGGESLSGSAGPSLFAALPY